MGEENNVDPVEAQMDAFNRRDLDQFMACYDKNVVIVDLRRPSPPLSWSLHRRLDL